MVTFPITNIIFITLNTISSMIYTNDYVIKTCKFNKKCVTNNGKSQCFNINEVNFRQIDIFNKSN